MKKILVTLVLIAVVVALLHLALFVFINLKGRGLIIAKLQKNFGQKVQLDSVTLSFPFALEIKNFQCGDISFRRAKASLGLANPFKHLLISNLSVDDLVVKVTLDRKGIRSEPAFSKQWRRHRKAAAEESSEIFSSSGKPSTVESQKEKFIITGGKIKKEKKLPLTISNLYLNNGRLQFTNALRREPVVNTINNINAHLKNFSYPNLTKFYLNMEGSLKTQEVISRKNIEIKGWVDYLNKDMDVTLGLEKIDYATFSAYYPPNWKPEKLGVKEAFLSLESKLISESNELTIKNILALDSIEYLEIKAGQAENPRTKTLKTVLTFLKGSRDKLVYNFVIITEMDSPKINLSSIVKGFRETVPFGPAMILQGVVGEFKEGMAEKLKNSKEVTVDEVGEIFKETGEEIVDTFKNIFKIKYKEKSE